MKFQRDNATGRETLSENERRPPSSINSWYVRSWPGRRTSRRRWCRGRRAETPDGTRGRFSTPNCSAACVSCGAAAAAAEADCRCPTSGGAATGWAPAPTAVRGAAGRAGRPERRPPAASEAVRSTTNARAARAAGSWGQTGESPPRMCLCCCRRTTLLSPPWKTK